METNLSLQRTKRPRARKVQNALIESQGLNARTTVGVKVYTGTGS